jgi:hypothetical protein
MTADNQLELKIIQNLETGEVAVNANKPTTFNVLLRLSLIALKGLKENVMSKIEASDKDTIIKMAFGEALQEQMKKATKPEAELKEEVLLKMEEEMYDMLNIAVGAFLDEEFPRVNAKPSLTEEAAAAAGLDRTASAEELVEAEKDFIENHPELAAQTQDMQPTEIKVIED